MMKHKILCAVGYCAVAAGGIGIVVPVLPTVPFILLAALCFSSSSPKMNKWLSENRYFGEYIDNYKTKSGVSRKKKTISVILLWAMLLVSIVIFRENMFVLAILITVGTLVSVHIALLTKRPSCDPKKSDSENL